VDLSEGAMRHLLEIVGTLRFDVCVLTGDYRGQTVFRHGIRTPFSG